MTPWRSTRWSSSMKRSNQRAPSQKLTFSAPAATASACASRAPAATTGSMHSITGWKPRDSLGRPHDKATGGLALDKNDAFVKDTEMLRYRLALFAAATSWMPARAAAQAPARTELLVRVDDIGMNHSVNIDRKSTRLNSSHMSISYAV